MCLYCEIFAGICYPELLVKVLFFQSLFSHLFILLCYAFVIHSNIYIFLITLNLEILWCLTMNMTMEYDFYAWS